MTVVPSTRERQPMVATLDKGLRVLDGLAEDPSANGVTLGELARRLDIHRTTLFRLLTTLRARGFVARDPGSDRYRLGTQILVLASSLLEQLDLRQVARPILVSLRDQTRELVHLVTRDGDAVVTIDRIEGTQPLSLQTGIGARRPIACTASGKAILAHLPEAETERVLCLGLPGITARSITDETAMRQQLDEVRRRGYAWDDEERVDGVRCVAAPIFSYERQVLGAVSIAAPTIRTPLNRLWALGEEVRAAAGEISHRLGGPNEPVGAEAERNEASAGGGWRDGSHHHATRVDDIRW